MRRFRDRDFLRTKEGLFFCVVGSVHPLDRVISYIKYVPADFGKWGKGKRRFKRVLESYTIPGLLESFDLLRKRYPHYLFYSKFLNVAMSAVPLEYVEEHYKPEKKLARLLRTSRLDPLQQKLKEFITFLSDISGIPENFFGVTGSILLDIHRPEFSDIDVTVYGSKSSLALKKALTESYNLPSSFAHPLKDKALKNWCNNKAQHYPLTFDEAFQIYKRKWNIGIIGDVFFSIHPVKLDQEVKETYGDKTYRPLGPATIEAVVYENADSLFLPCVYHVKNVEILEGPIEAAEVKAVVSYESLYDSLAQVGERIACKGKLEQVINNKTKYEQYQLLVGSTEGRGTEYVKLIS